MRVYAIIFFLKKTYARLIILPGSKIIDFRRLKTPSTAMPSILKGSMANHTMGYNTKAKIANGQQNTNRNIQAIKVIIC